MLATPKWNRLFLFSTAVCLVWGCQSGGGTASPTAPAPDAGTAPAPYTGPGATLKVMTRNLYFGAEINASLATVTAAEIPAQVATLWATVQQSDFPGRAKLIVDEIVAEQPDIIAFQEMELFRTQSPSDFVPGASPTPRPWLRTATCGPSSRVSWPRAVSTMASLCWWNPHTDIELPAVDASGAIYDLRMTDRNVVFVRPNISASNPRGQDFASSFSVPLGGVGSGISIKLARGFGAVDLLADGVPLYHGEHASGDWRLIGF